MKSWRVEDVTWVDEMREARDLDQSQPAKLISTSCEADEKYEVFCFQSLRTTKRIRSFFLVRNGLGSFINSFLSRGVGVFGSRRTK